MLSRIRAKSKKPRNHKIPIAFNDLEYEEIIKAAYIKGITPSTFIANTCLAQAKKINEKCVQALK